MSIKGIRHTDKQDGSSLDYYGRDEKEVILNRIGRHLGKSAGYVQDELEASGKIETDFSIYERIDR